MPDDTLTLAPVEDAIDAMRRGELVIVVDDEDRENEGDFVVAAEHMTPKIMNTLITEGRGLVCCAMHAAHIDRFNLPMMVPDNRNSSGFGTGFTVSVEAAHGVSTGISAADRSHTVRILADPDSGPGDIATPGHVFPLRAKDGGVLERRGQTEASVDLAVLAGLQPAAVICEILRVDGSMMRLPELLDYGQQHGMPVISVEALAQYRAAHESEAPARAATPTVRKISQSTIPTAHGTFDLAIYQDHNGREHSLLSMGKLDASGVLTRIHSECLTGDAFGSQRCDCGEQLQMAMAAIAERGTGAIVYLRQEGRGIGLGNKIRAYELQDQGRDTVEANLELGFPADAREYSAAADMLRDAGVQSVQLMTNNPAKIRALNELGIPVDERKPHATEPLPSNTNYLKTKAGKLDHLLPTSH